MKLRLFALVLAVWMLLSGCTSAVPQTDSGAATTETKTEASNAVEEDRLILPKNPLGEIDLVHQEIREYIAAAEKCYASGDTSFSAKTNDTLGELYGTVRFAWEYHDSDSVKSAELQISRDKSFSSFTARECGKIKNHGHTLAVENLETGAKLYWRVLVTKTDGTTEYSNLYTFETLPGPRILTIDGVSNARDLGGWQTSDGVMIREGRIYRAAKLDNITEDGKKTLVEELGVRTELDLRSEARDTMNPPELPGVQYINIPAYSNNSFSHPTVVADVMRVFTLPENYPILFHCAGGADRTGAAGFFLNALCGVDLTHLICDYELTKNRYLNGCEASGNIRFSILVKAMYKQPGNTVQERVYGFLLNECELSEMELANIRALMTTDSAVYPEPPREDVKAVNGVVTVRIDVRSSGDIVSVTTSDGESVPFQFENGTLTLTPSATGIGTVTFTDGATLPLCWTMR